MNVTAQKFQSQNWPVYKSLASINHRTTLPQSALRAASSLREGAGIGCTIHRTARKLQRCGRFSSPLRNSKVFTFHHSTGDTPSGREPGWGGYHSTGCLRNRKGAGDFHRPYEGSEGFTFHHSLKDSQSGAWRFVLGLFVAFGAPVVVAEHGEAVDGGFG